MGWGGVVGEVGNKANTAQLVVGVKVVAELGNLTSPKVGIVKVKHVVTAILDLIRFPPSFPGLKGLIKLYLNLGGLMGNILEKKCLNYY